jgi:hypothetical protein
MTSRFSDDDTCMDHCIHAKQCFASCDDPDEALKTLTEEYCEHCIFASIEED